MHKILIVDDSEGLLVLYETLLSYEFPNVEVLIARNAIEALSQITNLENPSELLCVISDYDMGEINGVQLTRKIRKKLPLLPLFIHTHSGEDLTVIQQQCEDINVEVLSKRDSMKGIILPSIKNQLLADENFVLVATLI